MYLKIKKKWFCYFYIIIKVVKYLKLASKLPTIIDDYKLIKWLSAKLNN